MLNITTAAFDQLWHSLYIFYFDIEIRVQQHVAGLQVQVEQRGGQLVEKVYAHSHLMSQSEDKGQRWRST